MKKILLILILLPNILFAQTNYNLKFREVINEIENNYSGFADKTGHKKEYYELFKDHMLKDSIVSIQQLKKHIDNYCSYFGDDHLFLFDFHYNRKILDRNLAKLSKEYYQFETINSNTCVLKVKSFYDYHKVDSLIAANIDTIQTKKNLIIDLRSNGGGNFRAFESLLPIIATNDIYTRNIELLATTDIYDYCQRASNGKFKKWDEKDEGTFIQSPWIEDTSLYIKHFKYKATEEFPKHVAILVNRKVASAAEEFCICAKQSFKVKIFGENTRGVNDYGNLRYVDVIRDSLSICVPMSRKKGLPANSIDKHGIVPDFYLKPDKQIEQIVEYLNYWN